MEIGMTGEAAQRHLRHRRGGRTRFFAFSASQQQQQYGTLEYVCMYEPALVPLQLALQAAGGWRSAGCPQTSWAFLIFHLFGSTW